MAERGADRATEQSIAERLSPFTVAGELVTLEKDRLTCVACAHRCVIAEGRAGACGVRFRRSGELRVPFGYVARRYVRPVETNTMYHVLPGSLALTFGMYGCDLRCPYCHNWKLSQALREPGSTETPSAVSPDALVDEAIAAGARVIVSAYNEPMITAEWARAVFAQAKSRGLVTAVVSDGNATPEVLAYLRPVLDVFRIDLKGFSQDQYRTLGGRLEPVLASIGRARELGYWVEVVTLVVPTFNDDARGLRDLAKEIARIDADIPWHLNAFFPRYKLLDLPRTTSTFLLSMAGAGYANGLRFVYAGNVANELPQLEHTRCPSCAALLVERSAYRVVARHVQDGRCPSCSQKIPGLFEPAA
jgi:pyruvate formate lyase activating enzyme